MAGKTVALCSSLMEMIKVRLTGVDPKVVHIHIHQSNTEVLERLTIMEIIMSDVQAALDAQTEAINANTAATNELIGRVDEDVAHLQDLLAQALATDAADQATIDQLRADAAATVGRITDATTAITASTGALAAVDPDPTFPATEPPVS